MKRMSASLFTLVALTPTLFGMNVAQTRMEQLPHDIRRYVLLPYLKGSDEDLVKYVKTVREVISPLELEGIVEERVAQDRLADLDAARKQDLTLQLMFKFKKAGISAADLWLQARVSEFAHDGNEDWLVPIFKRDLNFAKDPRFLAAALTRGSLPLIEFIGSHRELRKVAIEKAPGMAFSPLAHVFPLTDVKRTASLLYNFGQPAIIKAAQERRDLHKYYSDEVAPTFNDPYYKNRGAR